jgi:hypothetical protein
MHSRMVTRWFKTSSQVSRSCRRRTARVHPGQRICSNRPGRRFWATGDPRRAGHLDVPGCFRVRGPGGHSPEARAPHECSWRDGLIPRGMTAPEVLADERLPRAFPQSRAGMVADSRMHGGCLAITLPLPLLVLLPVLMPWGRVFPP